MIERVFAGWDEPLLPAAARLLTRRYGKGRVVELEDVTIVLPGGRAGRRLKELLLDEAQHAGLKLVPPRVITPGKLPELFFRPLRGVASPIVIRRAWAETLRSADRTSLALVFPEPPAREDQRGWDRLADQVQALQREVAGGGHTFGDVSRVCAAGDLIFDDASRWEALALQQRRYALLLAELGFEDPDLARLDALGRAQEALPGDLVLIGLSELPAIARAHLLRVTSPVTAIIHAPAEEGVAFDGIGCVLSEAWTGRAIPIEAEQLKVVDRPSDQAAEIVRQASLTITDSTAEMVVGALDASLVPYLEEWLRAAGIGSHYAAGRTAGQSGPIRLLRAVADYLERGGWEELAALIRHPAVEPRVKWEGGDSAGELVTIGRLDREFMKGLPAEAGPPSVVRPSNSLIHSARARLEDRLLHSLRGTRRIGAWMEPLLTFLGDVYTRPGAASDPEIRKLADLLTRVRDEALEIRRLPERLSPECGAATAIRTLLDLVEKEAITEESEPLDVEILGWLELAMDDAPVALVAGFNEGFLPETRNADPFLPDQLRSRLGLLDNTVRYARDAFLLTAMVSSRRHLRLVAGRLTPEGDPLRPSRLALTARGVELARRVRELQSGAGGEAAPSPPLVAHAGERSRFTLPPAVTLDIPPPTELRVTDFARILDDPYRHQLERTLGLRRADDAGRELDPAGFGDLVHGVLAAFGHSAVAASSDAAEVARALDEILDCEAARTFGDSAFPAVYLQIEQIRLRLRRFAAWQADRVEQGWRIVLVESVPAGQPDRVEETPGAPFDVDGIPILLTGRIDRVDYHPATNQFAILDYKTSDRALDPEETHRRKRSREWKDLQLPLYRHLLDQIRTPDGSPLVGPDATVQLGYVLLSRDLAATGAAMALWTSAELGDADEAARDVVRRLREGKVSFDRSRVSRWPDDPLGPLMGMRLLLPAEDELEEEELE